MILAAFYHPIFATLFALFAILLMLVILLQRGRGVGLQGAFGGAGGHTAFGSKTGDILTWITVIGAGVFLFFVVILNYIFTEQRATLPTPPGGGAPGAPAGGTPGGTWVVPANPDDTVFVRALPFGEDRF
jgi:preprotein translocase subunit SecG